MAAAPYYRPLALLLPLLCLGLLHADSAASITAGTPDGSELWGYVEVRPSDTPRHELIFLHFSFKAVIIWA